MQPRQLKLYEKHFEKIEILGSGTYSDVYKAIYIPQNNSSNKEDSNQNNQQNEQIVALKKLKLQNRYNTIDMTALREISILREIDHPNILKLFDVLYGINSLYLCLELMDYELGKLILPDEKNKKPPKMRLSISLIKNVLYQILKGLEELKKRCILHRDMKSANIFINKKGEVKIADFGLSRYIASPGRQMSSGIATVNYRSPEILFGATSYSYGLDMWATGCIFADMILGMILFYGISEIDVLRKIFMLLGIPNENNWPDHNLLKSYKKFTLDDMSDVITIKKMFDKKIGEDGISLLEGMLTLDPNKRITVEEALKHPFFTNNPQMASNDELAKSIEKELEKEKNKYL